MNSHNVRGERYNYEERRGQKTWVEKIILIFVHEAIYEILLKWLILGHLVQLFIKERFLEHSPYAMDNKNVLYSIFNIADVISC